MERLALAHSTAPTVGYSKGKYGRLYTCTSYFISGVLLLVVGYLTVSGEWYLNELLSCQPRVTVTSCFVYKVIRDLYPIDHMCINPIRRIGSIHK